MSEWLAAVEYRERWGEESPVNIFYLDHDPAVAARYHCDKHVVKMVTETAQLLSTVWQVVQPELVTVEWNLDSAYEGNLVGPPSDELSVWHAHLGRQRIYKKTHVNHPCALWAGANTGNYEWLWRLGVELAYEYQHRYKRQHATLSVLYTLECPPPKLPEGEQTQPPPVMPEELTVSAGEEYDTVASYRNLYVEAKQWLLAWTRRAPPEWLERRGERWALR